MNALFFISALIFAAPKIEISEPSFDFGYSLSSYSYRHTFRIYNKGDSPLRILGVRTFCGCSTTELSKRAIESGDSASFEFLYETQGFFAECVKWAYVRTDDPEDSLSKINVTIRLYEDYKRTPFSVEPEFLFLGKTDSLKSSVNLVLKNNSKTDYTIKLVETPVVLEEVDFQPGVLEAGQTLNLALRPRTDVADVSKFKSSITFEAYTQTETVRFSVPLLVEFANR
ncbi:DUF1573 domain-containing protein [bacterium]|nr:DUF1573 domain-containing protein [bacterium]